MNPEPLTPREQDVLNHLSALPFRSQQEIAKDLGISGRTVRTHISTILGKTGMNDQRELVLTELYRRLQELLDEHSITEISRAGRTWAAFTIKKLVPVDVDEAIVELKTPGHTIVTLSINVQPILEGLEAVEQPSRPKA